MRRCCWVMLFCCGWVLAAVEATDYEALLKKSADGEKASVLVNWAYAERIRNIDLSRQKAQEALVWAEKNAMPQAKAMALGLIGLALLNKGQYEESEQKLLAGLAVGRRHQLHQAETEILNWLGILHFYQGHLDQAKQYYEQVISKAQTTGNRIVKASALSNLGLIARRYGRTTEAMNNFFTAVDIYEQHNEIALQAIPLTNIGALYYRLTRYDKALEFYERAKLIHEGQGNAPGTSSCLLNIGIALSYMDREGEARRSLLEALEIRRRLNDPAKILNVLLGLVYLELDAKDFAAAERYLEEGRKLLDALPETARVERFYQTEAEYHLAKGQYVQALASVFKAREYYKDVVDEIQENDLNLILSQIYSEMGDDRQAYHFYKLYRDKFDHSLGSEMAGAMSDIENEKRRKLMDRRIQELTVHRRRLLWGGIGLTLVLLAVLAAAIFAQRSLKRRNAAILALKEDEIHQVQNRLQWMKGELREFLKQKNRPRYEHSGLDAREALRLKERLVAWMKQEESFLNPDLTLTQLAQELSCRAKDLSQVINEGFNRNFNDFINGYRVEMAKRMLIENRDLVILELAYDVGFNSKSSFNASFKKLTGLSPRDFRDRHHEAVDETQTCDAG